LTGLSIPKHRCSCLPSASSRLKVYANIKLQGTTPGSEDSIKLYEGRSGPKTTKATREASTLQDLNLQAGNLLTPEESFGHTRKPNPTNLTVSRHGFDKIFWQRQLFSRPLQQMKANYIFGKVQVFSATQSIIGELEEKLLRPNSGLVSAPLTTTLRNLGTRFCLRGEEL
jgi:hypothetical protein